MGTIQAADAKRVTFRIVELAVQDEEAVLGRAVVTRAANHAGARDIDQSRSGGRVRAVGDLDAQRRARRLPNITRLPIARRDAEVERMR